MLDICKYQSSYDVNTPNTYVVPRYKGPMDMLYPRQTVMFGVLDVACGPVRRKVNVSNR